MRQMTTHEIPSSTKSSSHEVRNATWLVDHLTGGKNLFPGRPPRASEVACVVAAEAFRQLQLGNSIVEVDPVTQDTVVVAPDSVFLGNHVNVGCAARSVMEHLNLPGGGEAADMASKLFETMRAVVIDEG